MKVHLIVAWLYMYRCIRNCGRRSIVQEAVELKLLINESFNSPMYIEWSITPSVNWEGESGTWNNRRTLSIYENTLRPGTVYTICVKGE